MGEIEAWVETKSHDGCRSLRCAHAGEHAHDTLVVHAQMMKAGVEGQHTIEMGALDPILILTGKVAGIFAGLVHGNNDRLDGNRRNRSRVKCARRKTEQQAEQTTAHLHRVFLELGWFDVSRVTQCVGQLTAKKASYL